MNSLNEIETGIYAAIAGLIVGGLTKMAGKLLDRRKDELELHTTLRKELREELDAVKQELHNVRKEMDEWREKYFEQVELTTKLQADILRLTEELTEYKNTSGSFPIIEEPK